MVRSSNVCYDMGWMKRLLH